MAKNLLVDIPEPCHEDWAAMKLEEQGRFCASCCKTVIDFSLMSDRELLSYLAGASGKVCGRFAGDQLQRDLMPAPPRRNRIWIVWNLLLAGLLISSKGRGQGKTSRVTEAKAAGQVIDQAAGQVINQVTGLVAKVTAGATPGKISKAKARAPLGKKAFDSILVMGDRSIQPDTDSLYLPPHITELPPVEVIGYSDRTWQGFSGCMMIVSGKTFSADSTESWSKRLIADTLSFLGMGKKNFSLYPNPARRGTTIKLSINLGKTGGCVVGLYNEAGALLQEKAIEAGGDSQVELFNIPGTLPGGIYFVRLSAPEMKKTYTEKLVVL